MTTTISKVILFKKFIMSKKCQELASGLLWVNSERKDGGREEGDSVLGKPLLLNHFLYPPQLLFAFLRAQVPSTSTLWQFLHQFTKLSLFFSKAASSHSLTLLSTLLYQLHNSSHGKMTNVLSKQNNYYIQLSNSPFLFALFFHRSFFSVPSCMNA